MHHFQKLQIRVVNSLLHVQHNWMIKINVRLNSFKRFLNKKTRDNKQKRKREEKKEIQKFVNCLVFIEFRIFRSTLMKGKSN